MRASSPAVKLTYGDFVLFPDDGKRHELIDGEHYVTPSPNTKHQRVSINLTVLIGGWLERNPIGQVFHREGNGFARVVELSAESSDVLTTTLLPGLEIPLSRVFKS